MNICKYMYIQRTSILKVATILTLSRFCTTVSVMRGQDVIPDTHLAIVCGEVEATPTNVLHMIVCRTCMYV